MNPNHELDHILDQALKEYREAEPLAGLEERILRRITEQPVRSYRWLRWTLAAATAAVLVAAFWIGFRGMTHPSGRKAEIATVQQKPSTESKIASAGAPSKPSVGVGGIPSPRATKSVARVPHTGVAADLRWASSGALHPVASNEMQPARPTQFPTPAPITAEEHALIALARTHPRALLNETDTSTQLNIAPIDIEPLAPETGATQGESQ